MLDLLVIALPIAIPQAVDTARPSSTITAFVNVSVIPMDRERVLAGQTVVVRGSRIVALGPGRRVRVPAGATRVDGRGKFLIPGLADMHVHLDQAKAPPMSLMKYIANGITTIRIMRGEPSQLALREQVKRGALLGPTIYASSPQVHSLSSPEEAVARVAEYKAAGYDLIKMYNPKLTIEVLDSFVAAARRVALPVGGHVPSGEVTLARWLEAHPVSIEHFDGYWTVWRKPFRGRQPWEQIMEDIETGAVRLDDSALAVAAVATKRAGIWNVPTMAVNEAVNFGMLPKQHQHFIALRNRVFKVLRDAGVGMLVGTDAPTGSLEFGSSVHTELQLLVAAGLTPYQALEAGTRNVALAMGTLDQAGTIEVGKRADLVLLNGNPLQDIQNTRQPLGVMLGGRWIPRREIDTLLSGAN